MSFKNPENAIEHFAALVKDGEYPLSTIAKSIILEAYGPEEYNFLNNWVEISSEELLFLHKETEMNDNSNPNNIDDVLLYMSLEEGYLVGKSVDGKIILNIREKAYTFE